MRGAGGGHGRRTLRPSITEFSKRLMMAPVADGPAWAERAWGALGRQAAAAPFLQAVGVQRHGASGWWVDTAPRVRMTGAGRARGPLLHLLSGGETRRGG